MPSRLKKVDSKGVRVSALLLPLIVATCLGCVAAEAGDEGPSGAVASRPAGPSAVYGGSAPTAPLPEEVAAALEEVGRLSAAGDLHAAAATADLGSPARSRFPTAAVSRHSGPMSAGGCCRRSFSTGSCGPSPHA